MSYVSTMAIYSKYVVINNTISNLTLKDKRFIFHNIRNYKNINSDTLIPKLGFTVGEFSCFQILNENINRKKNNHKQLK